MWYISDGIFFKSHVWKIIQTQEKKDVYDSMECFHYIEIAFRDVAFDFVVSYIC